MSKSIVRVHPVGSGELHSAGSPRRSSKAGSWLPCVARLLAALAPFSVPNVLEADQLDECFEWYHSSDAGPTRRGHAMTFHMGRGTIVLFGGSESDVLMNDTWEYVPFGLWTNVSPTENNPPAREDHAMAYNEERAVTVLFGGANEDVLNDTWEWDGSTWVDVSPGATTPSARANHAMAAGGGVTILFGGQDEQGTYLGDTWEWDGSAWTLRATSGPLPRAYHSMASPRYGDGGVFLFGGNDGTSDLGDTWLWDGSTWSLISTGGPSPTANSNMAGHSMWPALVVDGTETWLWIRGSWVKQTGPMPSPSRVEAAMAASLQFLVLHGGSGSSGDLSDTWAGYKPLCVPTVSAWGAAVMALLVLTVGSIVLVRRRQAVA